MTCMRRVWRGGKLAFFVLSGWLAMHGAALAQAANEKKDSGSGSYVASYAIVLLGVGLGLLLVCRATHRRDRARPENYDESKAI